MVLAVGNQGCSAGTCVVIAGDLSPVSLLALGSAGCPQHLHHTRHWTATQYTLGQDNRISMPHGRLQHCMCMGLQHCASLVMGQPHLTLLEKSNWQGSNTVPFWLWDSRTSHCWTRATGKVCKTSVNTSQCNLRAHIWSQRLMTAAKEQLAGFCKISVHTSQWVLRARIWSCQPQR